MKVTVMSRVFFQFGMIAQTGMLCGSPGVARSYPSVSRPQCVCVCVCVPLCVCVCVCVLSLFSLNNIKILVLLKLFKEASTVGIQPVVLCPV